MTSVACWHCAMDIRIALRSHSVDARLTMPGHDAEATTMLSMILKRC